MEPASQEPLRVRQAVESDLDWVMGELKVFSEHYGTRRPLFGSDLEHTRTHLLSCFRNHPFFIAERGTERMGLIAGFLQAHPYNPEIRLLSESFWWIKPEYRRSRVTLLLFETFVAWGRANADWIAMFLEHSSPIKDSTFEKRGFRALERTFLLEVS